MNFVPVTSVICRACLRTCSNVISENGAASPGRWHETQLWKMIGATCSVNVGLVTGDVPEGRASLAAAAHQLGLAMVTTVAATVK